jgi:hypothetical protein
VSDQFLTGKQLARRWGLSRRTLERWRWLDQGPTYVKLGGKVVYRITDIADFERANVHLEKSQAKAAALRARAA